MLKKHYKSVFENEQELLKALIDIHLDGKDIELDPMYFKGNFYKDGVNQPKYRFGIHGKTKEYYSSKTHTIFGDLAELEQCYFDIIKEACRYLKPNGIMIFKCQDYTDSKTTMTHCIVKDIAEQWGVLRQRYGDISEAEQSNQSKHHTETLTKDTYLFLGVSEKGKCEKIIRT